MFICTEQLQYFIILWYKNRQSKL